MGKGFLNPKPASDEVLLTIGHDIKLKPDGYRLKVTRKGITMDVQSAPAAYYAVQTLGQVIMQSPMGKIPCLTIHDWPDFPVRGIYYDISRGRVPTLDQLLDQVELLSHFKINHYQPYIEHTFRFKSHPGISKGASPLTADDLVNLGGHCATHYVEMTLSFASFGHMSKILARPKYRHMAEDRGVLKYTDPDSKQLPASQRRKGWTISPANPKSYRFLGQLYDEILPLYNSDKFNVCCDETWDLGLGQTSALCRRKGKARVFMDHILKLKKLAEKHHKKIMVWGDMIRKYPRLLKKIPRDITVLDWAYDHNHKFNSLKDFTKNHVTCYACPGTSSWVSLFPRLHESSKNIHGFAAAAKKLKVPGLLVTDWGDGGHYNFMEYSWYGYLFGAEQAWNTNADRSTFTKRFANIFLRSKGQDLVRAIDEFGDICHLSVDGLYGSVWLHIFFATPDDELFNSVKRSAWLSRKKKIRKGEVLLNARFAKSTIKRLRKIRTVFASHSRKSETDPHGVLPYWIFAVDTMIHAARKIAVLGKGGSDNKLTRKSLRKEITGLMKRFEKLWHKRNRPSEIKITLNRYRKTIKSL